MMFDERDAEFPPDSDSDTDDDNALRRPKFPRYNPKCDMKNIDFCLHVKHLPM